MSFFVNEIVDYLIEITVFFFVSFAIDYFYCEEQYSQDRPTVSVILNERKGFKVAKQKFL